MSGAKDVGEFMASLRWRVSRRWSAESCKGYAALKKETDDAENPDSRSGFGSVMEPSAPQIALVVALCLLSFVGGCGIGWWLRGRDLHEEAEGETEETP